MLPIPASVRGASRVAATEIVISGPAGGAVAALDERASGRGSGDAALPFRQLMAATLERVTREWGLTSGRPLKLLVEIDDLGLASTGGALLGQEDRLAGSVFIRDAATGAPLGQLYIDIDQTSAGLVGLAIRGGGVREKLAEEFATRVARQLSGRSSKP